MLTCVLAGAWAYRGLGRSEDPPYTVKVMLVKALWRGATITDTVNLVTDKLEKKLEELPFLDYVRSQTKAGDVAIYVHLKDSIPPQRVSDMWQEVRNKISDVWYTLPAGTQGPFFDDHFGETYGIICALTGDGFTHREMRDYAEKIRTRLLRAPDVSRIELIGTIEEKIYIEFSAREFSNLGLDANAVVRAIQAPNLVLPAGEVSTENERIVIRVSGAYATAGDVAGINLYTSKGFLRLGDIAKVIRRYADPPAATFRFKGAPAIGLAIAMKADGDILRLGETIRRELSAAKSSLPVGLDMHLVADQAEVVTRAVHGFLEALLEAMAIVLLVGFVALGLRAGLVVAVAIPAVLAITFAAMLLAGIALQRVSLGALVVSLGLLVDDAMITVEMVISKLEEGMDHVLAASHAYTTTAFPMLTGTLVTVAGFHSGRVRSQQCRRIHQLAFLGDRDCARGILAGCDIVLARGRRVRAAQANRKEAARRRTLYCAVPAAPACLHAAPLRGDRRDGWSVRALRLGRKQAGRPVLPAFRPAGAGSLNQLAAKCLPVRDPARCRSDREAAGAGPGHPLLVVLCRARCRAFLPAARAAASKRVHGASRHCNKGYCGSRAGGSASCHDPQWAIL